MENGTPAMDYKLAEYRANCACLLFNPLARAQMSNISHTDINASRLGVKRELSSRPCRHNSRGS